MQFEPKIEPARGAEALLIVLDSSVPEDPFQRMRDAAFRLARTRLLYPIGKDDLIGVIQAGSAITANVLADANPGGYQGIQLHVPLVTASMRALNALNCMNSDRKATNLLDLLEVSGDRLVTAAALRARTKRLLLFTHVSSVLTKLSEDSLEEFVGISSLYRQYDIRIDIVLHGPSDISEQAANYLELFEEEEGEANDDDDYTIDEKSAPQGDSTDLPSPQDCIDKAQHFLYAPLLALTKTTGGVLMSLEEALPLVENPKPKSKRATAKFYGVLDIANEIQIPVKRYTHVSEVKTAPGKKLSWAETCKRRRPVYAYVETNRVASAKDDTTLQPEQIINAYPYGPDLVPESSDADGYAWGMCLDRGLHVLCFVPQQSVPQHYFLSSVDVVLPIQDSPEAVRLMRTLVLALHSEKLGILARSVVPKNGGAPTLCYLWPNIELSCKTRKVQNCYLFAADVPMREDIRKMAFSSLKDAVADVSEKTFSAMNKFVSLGMLNPDENDITIDLEEDDEDECGNDLARTLIPSKIINPNLNYMQMCVAHRILEGTDGTGLPPLAEWHEKLMNEESYLNQSHSEQWSEILGSLKSELPIIPVKKKESRGQRIHKAVDGDVSAIVNDCLPEENVVASDDVILEEGADDNDDDDDDDLVGDEDVALEMVNDAKIEVDANTDSGKEGVKDSMTISAVTGLDVIDVGDETPVEDLMSFVRHGQFRLGALSMQVVLRRLIRDGGDEGKIASCLQALRKVSIDNNDAGLFNSFVLGMAQRCKNKNALGNRTASVFRNIGSRGVFDSTLRLITPSHNGVANDSLGGQRQQGYGRYLEERNNEIEALAMGTGKNLEPQPSMSQIQD